MNNNTSSSIDISVLISCYNEEEYIVNTIDTVFDALKESKRSFEILIIDDYSSDNSVSKIQDHLLEIKDERIRLKINIANRGVGNVFMDGSFIAKGKYYRINDGDCPESKKYLVKLFSYIGKADMVIPNPNPNHPSKGRSIYRRYISIIYTFIINLISGNNIYYYNSSPIIDRLLLQRYPPVTSGLCFQADFVTKLLDENITYIQPKIDGFFENKGQNSTALTFRNLLSFFHILIEIIIRKIKRIFWKTLYSDREQSQSRELIINE